MRESFVRCIDCALSEEMITADNIVVRCTHLGVGRVKRAKRTCRMYSPKEQVKKKR